MKRVLVVYNPRSSKYKKVQEEVVEELLQRQGLMVGKYEVLDTNVDDNAKKFAKLVRDDDLVIAAGGDATAAIAANGILNAGKDARLAVLPYGNFNDLARTLGTRNLAEVFDGKIKKMWPLEIVVDGRHFRYATCYVTIGMTAEAVELFDDEKVRKDLQKGYKSSWKSYVKLASWYFRNRRKKAFLPKFKLNGELMDERTTDYAAVNGRSMARVMKGADWFLEPKNFQSGTDRLANFWRLFKLMTKSILVRTPGDKTSGDILEFVESATVELQAEGEYKVFEGVKKIEVRKAIKCLKVVVR